VLFLGHSAKKPLPRATLGKVLLLVTSSFTECRTLGTETHSAKIDLPSGKHLAKVALGCNALNLGVEFFLLFFHQIQALPFSFSHSLAKP
jgi:hypothetical protein